MLATHAMALLALVGAQSSPSPFVSRTGSIALLTTSSTADDERLLADLRARLESHTDLVPRSGGELGIHADRVRRCGGRFHCWLDAVSAGDANVDFLLVTSVLVDPKGPDRVAWALLDVELGRRVNTYAPGPRDQGSESRDSLIFRDAVQSGRAQIELSEPRASRRVTQVILQNVRPWLIKARHWVETGAIEVSTEIGRPLVWSVDGWPAAHGNSLTVTDVRAGVREVAIADPTSSLIPTTLTATVHAGRTTHLTAHLDRRPVSSVRRGARWGGIALAAIGLGLALHAVSTASDGNRFTSVCDSVCTESNFVRLGPVLEAPLGYSLALTGAVWTSGSFLEQPDSDPPTWSIVAGLILGAAAYGLSAALD